MPVSRRVLHENLSGNRCEGEEGMEQKKRKKWTIVVVVIVVAAIAVGALYLGGFFDGFGQSKRQRDRDAAMGQLPYKSAEEMQAGINQVVEEGMFNISINSNPIFEDGRTEGNLGIENIPGNQYLMQVTITLDDTGQTVYESGLIEPGYYIDKAKLTMPLAAGEYPATALFTAVNPENETDEIGTGAANIVISIKN